MSREFLNGLMAFRGKLYNMQLVTLFLSINFKGTPACLWLHSHVRKVFGMKLHHVPFCWK